jgi:hypothetical protein
MLVGSGLDDARDRVPDAVSRDAQERVRERMSFGLAKRAMI